MGRIGKSLAIQEALLDEIRHGVYDDVGGFPSETELVVRFGVARETVRKAISELVREGLLERRQGSGTYVSERGRRKSGLLGLLVPDASSARIFRDFVSEIVKLAKRNRFDVIVEEVRGCTAKESAVKVRRIAREMAVRNVEGVIFRPFIDERLADANREVVRIFRNAKTPVVLMDADVVEPPNRSECDLVTIDNVAAGRRVAGHLLQRGRRRVAFMMNGQSIRSNANWRNRFFGVAGELALRKVENAVRPLDFGPDDVESLVRLFRSSLAPDAIVCGNDETAVTLMGSLRRIGKRVPDDLSVVGFDDADIAATCQPPMTTVRQPSRLIAKEILRALLGRMARPGDDPREVRVGAPLVVRAST